MITKETKALARHIVAVSIKHGFLVRQPCWCGEAGQAHHPNYSKPLEVVWLCQKHHSEEHVRLNRELENIEKKTEKIEIFLKEWGGEIIVQDECWIWTGEEPPIMKIDELIYARARGLAGRGVILMKTCSHKWCVNPWHMDAYRYKEDL